jgi:hypothetical protein
MSTLLTLAVLFRREDGCRAELCPNGEGRSRRSPTALAESRAPGSEDDAGGDPKAQRADQGAGGETRARGLEGESRALRKERQVATRSEDSTNVGTSALSLGDNLD